MESKRRGASKAVTAAAVILLGSLLGGAFYVGYASADAATLQVQAPNHINNGDSAQIQIHIQHASPSSPYAVTIVVTPQNSPAPAVSAGGPFCVTETVETDGGGNGQVTVTYPDTGDPSNLFSASACSPSGTGGPTTVVSESYQVTVTTSPAIGTGASTSFIVLPPQHVVTGTGTFSTHTTSTNAFIPATGCAGTAPAGGTCVESCTGPVWTTAAAPSSSTAPSTTTGPFLFTTIGSVELTGVISTITPGSYDVNSLISPCHTTPPTTGIDTVTVFYNLTDITVNRPDAGPIAGGLMITGITTASSVGTPGVSATTTALSHWTVTGTGTLRGLSGVGESTTTAWTVTSGGITTSYASSVYWVQLSNVPRI